MVVRNPETLAELDRLNAAVLGSSGHPFYGAPAVCVVLGDGSVDTCVEDGSLVIGYMMLAAQSLGVSSCWIHRAREVFETEEGKALLKKWGDLTEKYDCTLAQLVIAMTARMIPGLHVLCGARTPEQVLDNAGALNIKLDGADDDRMKWDVDAIS